MLTGVAAVAMALEVGRVLTERFTDVWDCLDSVLRGAEPVGQTYNGLLKALARQSGAVRPALAADLRRQALGLMRRTRRTRWLLLAVDGTKLDLPRTSSNERRFGVADNGVAPHAFLTTVVHADTGLVWDWRIGRADASEKHHLIEMVPDLPKGALILCDGNFVGYPVWSELIRRGVHFIARVGANIRLIKGLVPEAEVEVDRRAGLVWVWPKGRRGSCRPLLLRLVKVGRGEKTVHLLTSVLDPRLLGRREVGDLYRRRWGIEVFYRSLKQTMGLGKLRSASAERAELELWWGVVALAVVSLLVLPAILRRHGDPTRASAAQVLRVLRRALRAGMCGGARSESELAASLASALVDGYERRRPKRSRHRPKTRNTPERPRPRPPGIQAATPAMQRRAAARPHLWLPA
jgi:hypothetical protein